MKRLFLYVGIAMAIVSVRYFLDTPSHLAAAVAGAGLVIAAALCFVAAAIAEHAGNAAQAATQRSRTVPRSEGAEVPIGGSVR